MGVGIAPMQGRNRWWRRVLVALVACVTIVGIGLLVDRLVIGAALPPGTASAPRLRPIPVSAKACAQVSRLHDAAAQVRIELEYATAGYAPLPISYSSIRLPPRPVRVSWHSSRSRLSNELRTLDDLIRREAPAFPAPIQEQFATVRRDIATGEHALATSPDSTELLAEYGPTWSNAVEAFGSASDLVGTQCGSVLGAGKPIFGPCDLTDCNAP